METIMVSGLVAVLEATVLRVGFPTISYAHEATGIGDDCAPVESISNRFDRSTAMGCDQKPQRWLPSPPTNTKDLAPTAYITCSSA